MAVLKKCALLLGAMSLLASPVLAQVPEVTDFTAQEVEQGDALSQLSQLASNNTEILTRRSFRRGTTGCSPSNLRIRREW